MNSYPTLWFTSRTPIIEGQTHCAWARYMGYHAGLHGTGWRRIATAIPLATGSAVHTGLELLGKWLLEAGDKSPTPEVIAWAATEAAARYETTARKKGLLLSSDDASFVTAVDTLILEQRTLIEGLIWVWALVRLPVLLSEYRILDVEHEECLVLDCTCGLGEAILDWRIHTARQCQGIVQQGRADWLLNSRTTSEVLYVEFKTKSIASLGWERAWEHSGQTLVNMEAASRRLGRAVNSNVIDVLYKGRRDKSRSAGPEVPKMQQSSLCYGIYEPGGLGNGGVWRPRIDREHWSKTVPIWEDSLPMSPCRTGASRIETWVTMNVTSFANLIQVLGPFPRPVAMVEAALKSIQASERRWRIDIEDIRHGTDPETIIDRSWQCTGFDGVTCEFWPLCDKQPGWEQPENMGLYVPRTPHHALEKIAFEAYGVTFAPEDAEETD